MDEHNGAAELWFGKRSMPRRPESRAGYTRVYEETRWWQPAVVEVRGGFKTAPRYFGRRPEVACGGPARAHNGTF